MAQAFSKGQCTFAGCEKRQMGGEVDGGREGVTATGVVGKG